MCIGQKIPLSKTIPSSSAGMGVYCIINSQNDKLYVGSTRRDFHARISAHRSALRSGSHYNDHLQSSFNIRGEPAFYWSILQSVARGTDPRIIEYLEDSWCKDLKAHDPDFGYNTRPIHDYSPSTRSNQKIHRLRSPGGALVEIDNINKFCAENNLLQSQMSRVISGRRHQTGGWSLFDPIRPQGKRGRSKQLMRFTVISPSGTVISGVNGAEFSRQNGLLQSSFHRLLTGKAKTLNGWRLFKQT